MRLLYQLQSYPDPENWKELPTVVQSFLKHSTVERFWEAGASYKSKDEFIDEHMKAMQSLRDFADSVGHIVRYTREYTLLVIGAISSLGSIFYEVEEVPQLLLDSIIICKPGSSVISPGVSAHSWKHVINVGIRPVLKNCPEECAPKFMSAFLPKLFNTLDMLLCDKWAPFMVDHDTTVVVPTDDEEITEEILEENLVRQFTTVVVLLLLDCVGQNSSSSKSKPNAHQILMRRLIFQDINILAPFLKLLTHLISFKDGKCSFNSILLMKSCLAEVLIKDENVDEFFTVEVMNTLLKILLNQSPNKDSFYEALYVFTVIFLTLCKEYKSTRDFLYEVSHGYNIDELYENLKKVDDYKNQRTLMIEFLDWIKTANGTNDEGDVSHAAALERKRQEKRDASLKKATERLVKKNKDDGDMLDDPATEDAAFGSLFETA